MFNIDEEYECECIKERQRCQLLDMKLQRDIRYGKDCILVVRMRAGERVKV